ncbi:hypothetical protein V2J09_005452 [Rumex salicifolius]
MALPPPLVAGVVKDGGVRVGDAVVHVVCLPPKMTTFEKLTKRLSEVFFPDNPFHGRRLFSSASGRVGFFQKLLIILRFFFPAFQWGPRYTFSLFKCDVISGITIASLAIPQGISYAKLANLPPIIGLYSSFVPPLVYSMLGSSRHVAVGPVSIASLVMGTMLGEVVSSVNEPLLYLKLAFTSTFFAATLIGFMGGSAVIVSLQQLKGLLGMVHFTSKMQIIPVLSSVLQHKDESAKRPNLFWISAAAPLTCVILSTLIVFITKPSSHQVPVIGYLPKGLNPPSINMLYFHGPYLALAVKTGLITGILSLTEGIAVGRTFATLENYQVDGNKEMVTIGIMNWVGSFSSCYVTTGSFSRSAVNYNAGGQTAISNMVMASAILVTMLFLMPLFYYTPNVILAAIIITAVIGLIDYKSAFELWKVDKLDFVACFSSFLGVLLYSVPMGLAISVWISVFKILLHVTRPNIMALGNIPGTQIYHNINRYKEALRIPSFLILAIESPIYFANSTYLQERILRWVSEEEDRSIANNESLIKCLVLVNPAGNVMEKLHKSNVLKSFGLHGLYLTVGEAVFDVSAFMKLHP